MCLYAAKKLIQENVYAFSVKIKVSTFSAIFLFVFFSYAVPHVQFVCYSMNIRICDVLQSLMRVILQTSVVGMDLHELLDIPQGDRRKYHDDVTVMVVSLEGRIWKSSGKYP